MPDRSVDFQTDQKIKNLMADEAQKLSATDPDYAIRDLFNAIANKNYPSWSMHIQVTDLSIFSVLYSLYQAARHTARKSLLNAPLDDLKKSYQFKRSLV